MSAAYAVAGPLCLIFVHILVVLASCASDSEWSRNLNLMLWKEDSSTAPEVQRDLSQMRQRTRLIGAQVAAHLNFFFAASSAVLCLLNPDVLDFLDVLWVVIPCFGIWCVSVLYQVGEERLKARSLTLPVTDAGPAGSMPCPGSSGSLQASDVAYATLMTITIVVPAIHHSSCQGSGVVFSANRALFLMANLSTRQALAWNLAGLATKLASVGAGDVAEFVFCELCWFLGTMLATHVLREVCASANSAATKTTKKVSPSRPEGDGEWDVTTTSGTNMALTTILNATCDAVLFVDEDLRISRPSRKLEMMLEYHTPGSLFGVAFPTIVSGCSEDAEIFLKASSRPNIDEGHRSSGRGGKHGTQKQSVRRTRSVANAFQLSLRTSQGRSLTVRAFHVHLAGQDGRGGHVLGISELVGATEVVRKTRRAVTKPTLPGVQERRRYSEGTLPVMPLEHIVSRRSQQLTQAVISARSGSDAGFRGLVPAAMPQSRSMSLRSMFGDQQRTSSHTSSNRAQTGSIRSGARLPGVSSLQPSRVWTMNSPSRSAPSGSASPRHLASPGLAANLRMLS
mmetsp:Transcript_33003/g.87211  ORF Transcript_33003/g.87211 Transcript_33003/m.87211 type:complete len:567 (+) Transcript_33003:140-1840(+)